MVCEYCGKKLSVYNACVVRGTWTCSFCYDLYNKYDIHDTYDDCDDDNYDYDNDDCLGE